MIRITLMFFIASLFSVGIGQETRNIILLIGDGMGVSQVSAGITASKNQLNIEKISDIGFSKTHSASGYITDSGAGGTAIATGTKTFYQAIGVDGDTLPVQSILEHADLLGKSTGLVATSQVTHATPASFIAHQKNRYMYEEIAEDFLNTDIDVFIGGGLDHFNKRKDNRDLTKELALKGYKLAYTIEEVEEVEAVEHGKLAGLLYPNAPPRLTNGRGNMLLTAATKAIELLEEEENGFFLMIEGSQIDWGGHDNDTDYILEELLDFDKVVGMALDYAKKHPHTLVIVTADHETGGMGLTGGDVKTGDVTAQYLTTDHTGVMVPVFAFGPGSENFRGIYENTDLFYKMMDAFDIKTSK